MKWGKPPKIKIYEALGALADGRVELQSKTLAHVSSSSGQKFYTVTYDPEKRSIMANDNGSYWQGHLGYPAIAFLLAIGELQYDEGLSRGLKGIAWKDLNTKFKNDFEKTLERIDEKLEAGGISREDAEKEASALQRQIAALGLVHLGKKVRPPAGY